MCTHCLQSGVHLDACVNPNNRRADRRCCADGCPAMLLAQECPRRQDGVCRQLVEETAKVVEAGVGVVEQQDADQMAPASGTHVLGRRNRMRKDRLALLNEENRRKGATGRKRGRPRKAVE